MHVAWLAGLGRVPGPISGHHQGCRVSVQQSCHKRLCTLPSATQRGLSSARTIRAHLMSFCCVTSTTMSTSVLPLPRTPGLVGSEYAENVFNRVECSRQGCCYSSTGPRHSQLMSCRHCCTVITCNILTVQLLTQPKDTAQGRETSATTGFLLCRAAAPPASSAIYAKRQLSVADWTKVLAWAQSMEVISKMDQVSVMAVNLGLLYDFQLALRHVAGQLLGVLSMHVDLACSKYETCMTVCAPNHGGVLPCCGRACHAQAVGSPYLLLRGAGVTFHHQVIS